MLRNVREAAWYNDKTLLNEVLSLNAQEFPNAEYLGADNFLLNEVLSLNAQEFKMLRASGLKLRLLLNEVLSLNAQELEGVIWKGSPNHPQ